MVNPKETTVAVVGTGIAGLCTAMALLETLPEAKLLLVEGSGPEGTTTWAAAGMLCPVHELDFTELELLHLGRASQALYAQWAHTLPHFGYSALGALEVALTPNDVPYLQRQFEFQQQQGLPVQWMATTALRELEPNLSAQLPAGIFAPNDAQLDNRLLLKVLRQHLAAQPNVHWHLGQLDSLQPEANGYTAYLHTGVSLWADVVVLALGPHTAPGLAPWLPSQRVMPIKGQMLSVQMPAPPLLQRPVRIRSRQLGNGYIVPKPDRIVLGSTSEEMGHHPHLTAGGLLDILRKTYATVPGLYELPVLETWVGHRPSTLARMPFVETIPGHKVLHINGLYRHGILLGPLMGQRAAQQAASLLA